MIHKMASFGIGASAWGGGGVVQFIWNNSPVGCY